MRLRLKIWRQDGPDKPGRLVDYQLDDADPDMSFLEMLDAVNLQLVERGERVIEFDHDCREGICGTCGVVITPMISSRTVRMGTHRTLRVVNPVC